MMASGLGILVAITPEHKFRIYGCYGTKGL